MTLRLFGGKGGVGKTTLAAAEALRLADSGRRVLAVSTDPAHSLGDALDARLGPDPVPIPSRKGELLAAEPAAAVSIGRWMAGHRDALRALAERGTYLDAEDVDRLLDLAPPGGDELIAWLEVDRLASAANADEVVVDAAPTAHTLRLLASPETLATYAGFLDRLEDRHRELAAHFGGAFRPDAADALIAELAAEAEALARRLRDPEQAEVVWVLLPETLAVAETRDALAALDEAGIPVRALVVNRVAPPEGDEERRRAEAEAIEEIRDAFKDREIRFLPEMEKEPRGRTALRKLARTVLPNVETPRGASPRSPGAGTRATRQKATPGQAGRRSGGPSEGDAPRGVSTLPATHRIRLSWLAPLAPPTLRLLLFGGKGGVGKTTCSAALALELARSRPESRVLLLSTDPAHSLGDVLAAPLGDDERPVPGGPPNLRARELDSRRAWDRWRESHGADVGRAVSALAEGAGVADLLEVAPPGLDELFAVSTLLDAVFGEDGHSPSQDLVVVDTAPTGHALRLLEMPALALSWVRFLLSLLLKYREAVGLGDLAQGLLELSRSLKRLEALLRDGERTRFVAVTRPAELPRRETERLLDALGRLGIAVPAVVVNAVPPAGGRFRRPGAIPEGCAIIEAPARYPPPRGAADLGSWIRTWSPRPA